MKIVSWFSLVLAALSLVSGAAFAQTQNIPIPASSVYNNAYAVVAVTMPVLPADICTASNTNCFNGIRAPVIPNQGGPSGMYCGRAAVYTDNMAITDRVACDGHLVAYTAYYQAWMPAQGEYCTGGGDNPTCYPASPGYYYNTSSFATDCPSGYRITTTGSSGPYQYYACIKA